MAEIILSIPPVGLHWNLLPGGRAFSWRNCTWLIPSTVCPLPSTQTCTVRSQSQVVFNGLAGAVHACSDLDADVWIYWIAHGNFYSSPCLRFVYLGRCVMFWELWLATFPWVVVGADLATVNPKGERSSSSPTGRVINPRCPRWQRWDDEGSLTLYEKHRMFSNKIFRILKSFNKKTIL
jgi:hypothetical protein